MSRRKRRSEEPHENHERWLVSYADFITLLFAFFVVMYAISSVNEGKYRVLSDALNSAFKTQSSAGNGQLQLVSPPASMVNLKPQLKPPVSEVKQKTTEKMKNVAQDIASVMAPFVQQGQVAVIETDRGITVEINDSLLFPPGQAVLSPGAERAIRGVGAVIASSDYPVTIEGHTDNIPISTPLFPSNWELSAMRATKVARLMQDAGVPGRRLTPIGYADQRPVASNDTPEGRARNRRVALQLEAVVPVEPAPMVGMQEPLPNNASSVSANTVAMPAQPGGAPR